MLDLLTVPIMLRERMLLEAKQAKGPAKGLLAQQIEERNRRVRARQSEIRSLRRVGREFGLSHEMVRKICRD